MKARYSCSCPFLKSPEIRWSQGHKKENIGQWSSIDVCVSYLLVGNKPPPSLIVQSLISSHKSGFLSGCWLGFLMLPSCGQLGIWLGAGWSRMALSRMTWLCCVCFLIIQQAGQDSSHTGDRVPDIDTGTGRKLGCFYNSFTPVFCSQPA